MHVMRRKDGARAAGSSMLGIYRFKAGSRYYEV